MNTYFPFLEQIPDFAGDQRTQWFALHVRSNFERTVSTILRNKDFEEFLPTYRAIRRWSDRVKEEDLPLFPGYLFCRLDQYDRFPVLGTSGVVQIVSVGKIPAPIAPAELEAIWRITHSDLAVNPWPHLQAGEPVVVESGPLAGLEGIFVECRNHRRLVVSVTLLQRSVAVEIDGAEVRPASGFSGLIARSLAPRKGPGYAPAGQLSLAANRSSVGH